MPPASLAPSNHLLGWVTMGGGASESGGGRLEGFPPREGIERWEKDGVLVVMETFRVVWT